MVAAHDEDPGARGDPAASPGLVAAAVGTAIAFGVNTFLPAVSALTVAVVLGVLVGPFLPEATHVGLSWATKKFLRLGVVLSACSSAWVRSSGSASARCSRS